MIMCPGLCERALTTLLSASAWMARELYSPVSIQDVQILTGRGVAATHLAAAAAVLFPPIIV